MPKIEIETNFSFSKLVGRYKELKEEVMQDLIKREAETMKHKVATGTTVSGSPMQPIKDSTVLMRSIRKESINTPPLNASGKLLKSIKATKKGVSLKEYGVYQNDGYTPKKIPVGLSRQAVKKAKSKRGVFFKNNTKNIRVPARQFIHTDRTFTVRKKVLRKFLKGVHNALKK